MNNISNVLKKISAETVKYVKLNEIIDYIQPGKYIVSNVNYDDSFPIPVLTAGQTFILGYTDDSDGIYKASKDKPVIIFDDFTTSNHWVDFEFKVKSSAMKILVPKSNDINFKYVYYCIQNIQYQPTEHTRQWIQTFSEFEIALPELSVQNTIVNILDKFDNELSDSLNKEMNLRQLQYEFWRDKILSFENRKDVIWKKLKDIATEMYRGNGIKREDVTDDGIPCVRYGEIYMNYNIHFNKCISHTSLNKISSPKYFEKNDLLFAITGEKIEDIGKTIAYLGDEKCLAGGDIIVMKHNENAKYLSFALSTTSAIKQKGKGRVKSKVVHTNYDALSEIVVPIPSKEEQEKIASILDNLYMIANNMNSGLPAEIELRKKQYEYYRNKLLSFEELIVNE